MRKVTDHAANRLLRTGVSICTFSKPKTILCVSCKINSVLARFQAKSVI